VLSKARARWGVEAFKTFFERIVWQCVQVGLVDGILFLLIFLFICGRVFGLINMNLTES
jgi:hypothetical protein